MKNHNKIFKVDPIMCSFECAIKMMLSNQLLHLDRIG